MGKDTPIVGEPGKCLFFRLLLMLFAAGQSCCALQCYECDDVFHGLWVPLACQANVSQVPARQCNDEQLYCFVESVTVKGILTKITRDCVDKCYYGCRVTGFGFTAITCTSCCDSDMCNTGNHGVPYTLKATNEHWRWFFYSLVLIVSLINRIVL